MKEILNIKPELDKDVLRRIKKEAWESFSWQLKHLFVRVSLIEHRTPELLEILVGEDSELLYEFQQNAFVNYNKYINAYVIHPLFLDFLKTKHGLLSEDEKQETYSIAAYWSEQNDFLVDALIYYEKVGDPKSEGAVLEKIERSIFNHGKFFSSLWDRQIVRVA